MSRWWVVAGFVGAALGAWACNQPDSNPKDVISLNVDTAPAPSIVAGDTMRIGDSTALGRLQAQAYNINGKVLNVSVLWLTLDPAIVTTDTFGHVFAATDSVPSMPRIVAQAGGLQSLPFTIPIEPKPDSLRKDTLADTAQHIRGFCSTTGPVSTPINADLFHTSPLGDSTPIGVDNYLVHWAITAPPRLVGQQQGTIAHIDSLIAFVADLSGNPTLIDTTKGGGISTREVIFGANAFNTAVLKQDSTITVTVTATARFQGRQIHNPVSVNISFVNPSKC